MNLFVELDAMVPQSGPAPAAQDVLAQVNPDRFVLPTDIPSLSLLKAAGSTTTFRDRQQLSVGSNARARAVDHPFIA